MLTLFRVCAKPLARMVKTESDVPCSAFSFLPSRWSEFESENPEEEGSLQQEPRGTGLHSSILTTGLAHRLLKMPSLSGLCWQLPWSHLTAHPTSGSCPTAFLPSPTWKSDWHFETHVPRVNPSLASQYQPTMPVSPVAPSS